MRDNHWSRHAAQLAEAYARNRGQLSFELIRRAIARHVPPGPRRIVDVGGGYGQQAITLARDGHTVTVLDFDPNMLDLARRRLEGEPPEVRARVELVLGDGLDAPAVVGSDFDVACCHSVLMYEEEPAPFVAGVVGTVRPGGLVSLLSLNPEAAAMRSAVKGRWQEARATLEAGRETGAQYLPTSEPSLAEVTALLEKFGAHVQEWYGVGLFTEHAGMPADPEAAADAYEVEWLAGSRDPFRGVARCFHVVAAVDPPS
ncbi:MAG TPA: class I SAM-dependent methyltransferase [Acidimicrobiales bacterium]|jgi:SAM-dependent methyltransferase